MAHQRLIPSLKKFDLNYIVLPTENKGSWFANVNMKPEIIHTFLQKYDRIVWTDCDSEIVQEPVLFEQIDKAIAVHELDWNIHYKNKSNTKEILSGTIFLTKGALPIVEYWKENAKNFALEQQALEKYIRSNNVDFFRLPSEYCAIINREGVVPSYITNPVIIHYQASRTMKRGLK
jgi:hypothetical protein